MKKDKKTENEFNVDFSTLKSLDTVKQATKPEKNIVYKTLIFNAEDLEIFKDWVYYMQTTSGNPKYGHKDATNDLMKLVKAKYKDVKPRPDWYKKIEK